MFLFSIKLIATISLPESPSVDKQNIIHLPIIYVKNNTSIEKKLTSFTVSYSYSGSNEEYTKNTTTAIDLPSNKTILIHSSIKVSGTFDKSPKFRSIKNITVDGKTVVISDPLLGLDNQHPIIID
jgi:hypothetical protein